MVVAKVASKVRPYLAGLWGIAAGRRVVALELELAEEEERFPSRSSGGIIMAADDSSFPEAVASACIELTFVEDER